MIVIVALVGAYRQNGYGNVRVREALIIGALSPLGVSIGVTVANHVSERVLQLSFAALALFMAAQLVRRAAPPEQAGSIVYAQSVDSLTWQGDLPHLRSPVLVCSFRGWNDAAAAASTALAAVAASLDSEVVAQIDPEDYFDFQSTRPTISLDEGQTRRIEWPENNLDRGSRPDRRPRPRPARRHRAEPALAHLLGDDRDRRRRARGGDGDHPRAP